MLLIQMSLRFEANGEAECEPIEALTNFSKQLLVHQFGGSFLWLSLKGFGPLLQRASQDPSREFANKQWPAVLSSLCSSSVDLPLSLISSFRYHDLRSFSNGLLFWTLSPPLLALLSPPSPWELENMPVYA